MTHNSLQHILLLREIKGNIFRNVINDFDLLSDPRNTSLRVNFFWKYLDITSG